MRKLFSRFLVDAKILSHLLRRSPLPFYVGLWMVGQAIASLLADLPLFAAVSGAVLVLTMLGQRVGAAAATALIVGALSVHRFESNRREIVPSTHNGLMRVAGPLRAPKAGKLLVPMMCEADARQHSSKGAGNPSSLVGALLLCSAKDLPWRNAAALQQGDVVWVRATVHPLSEVGDGPLAYSSYLRRRGFDGECTLTHVSTPLMTSSTFIQTLRRAMQEDIRSVVGDGERSGVLLAMLIGSNDTLSRELVDGLSSLSLSHVLVVSGYQVTLWHSWMWLTLSLFLSRSSFRAMCSGRGFALVAVWFYVLIVGTEPSCVRAGIAILICEVVSIFERRTGDLQTISLALLGVTILWPGCFFEMGTQLTFAALMSLRLMGRVTPEGLPLWIKGLASSLVTTTVTSLVILCWSREIHPLGIVLNPLVVPLISILGGPVAAASYLAWFVGLDESGKLLEWTAEGLLEILYAAVGSRLSLIDVTEDTNPVLPLAAAILLAALTVFVIRSVVRRSRITLGNRIGLPRS